MAEDRGENIRLARSYNDCKTGVLVRLSMKPALPGLLVLLLGSWLSSCSQYTDAPALALTGVDGASIELNKQTAMTVVFFFSVSNPVALGAFEKLPAQLDDAADSVAIAMHVDRPPNVVQMQQHTLVPIVIDDAHEIAAAFGGIGLTPSLILIDKGKILLQQRGQLDYDAVNAIVRNQ